jgi:hypothetical protein
MQAHSNHTGRGITSTRRKSCPLNFVPIPNMMTWTKGTISAFKSYPSH